MRVDCPQCQGAGIVHTDPFKGGVVDQKTHRAMETCTKCFGAGYVKPSQEKENTMDMKTSDIKISAASGGGSVLRGAGGGESASQFGSPFPAVGSGQFPNDCQPEKEAVVHPSHYNCGKIEVIDAIEDWHMGFNDGNVIKYVARHRMKLSPKEDLEKAFWYLTRELMSHHGVTEIRLVEMVRGCIKDRPGTK